MNKFGIFSSILALITGVIHVIIGLAELFLWLNPAVYTRIDFTGAGAIIAKPIVQNVGVYNLFIAAGLLLGGSILFGLLPKNKGSLYFQSFFFVCVAIAGVVGAWTLPTNTTLFIQTLPGVLGTIFVWKAISTAKIA